jgi:hypothetical protein
MGDQDLELRPKTFEVLKFLAMNAGRLVAKQELYDAVWPNVMASDDSIAQCIRELRSKLGSAFSRPGSCEIGVIRGGSLAAGSRRVRSAIRAPNPDHKAFFSHRSARRALARQLSIRG